MINDETTSEGAAPEFDQRRRYPRPTIDLTATEVAGEAASHDPASASLPASGEREHAESAAESQSHTPGGATNSTGGSAPPGGNGPTNGPRLWPFSEWPTPPRQVMIAAAAASVVALIVIAGLWWSATAVSDRVARIQSQLDAISARATNASDSVLANRLSAIESSLKALAAETGNLSARVSEAADGARAARERAETAARLATQAAQTSDRQRASALDPSELDALTTRIAALEKSVKSVQQELGKMEAPAGDQAVRVALLATALRIAVERGNGFAVELSELKSVVKNPQQLAPLEPFAEHGVPTPQALQRDLTALAPALLQAAKIEPSEGGFLSRLQSNAEHLIRVRPIEESPGDDPANVILRIELKTARGDIPGVLTEFAKLPPPVRAPAEAWIKQAEGREAAINLARKISTDALGALTLR